MKKYLCVGCFRKTNIKVFYNDTELIYDGDAEAAPYEIQELYYSKIKNGNGCMEVYVYDD